jgi:hypothetical protein
MDIIKSNDSFHDWYILGLAVNPDKGELVLSLLFDNKRDRTRLIFKGASRCLVNDFLIQNIILSISILDDVESEGYRKARAALDKSYPWGKGNPSKKIAAIQATLGAELFIEFDSVEMEPIHRF